LALATTLPIFFRNFEYFSIAGKKSSLGMDTAGIFKFLPKPARNLEITLPDSELDVTQVGPMEVGSSGDQEVGPLGQALEAIGIRLGMRVIVNLDAPEPIATRIFRMP
jgi:hypothetical protein